MGILLFWRRKRDLLSPAGSVRHGSDSPPGCHSLPCRSNPTIFKAKDEILKRVSRLLAEKEGFEPSRPFPALLP